MSSNSAEAFEVFGEYILLKPLAAGGMAEVFLARPSDPNSNGRIVVIKRILKNVANDPVFIQMFRAEIRVSLGFSNPHTIQIHDSGELEGQPYLVMEYIEGKSLKQIMERFTEKHERIPVATVLGLLAQTAAGLHYAHRFENVATGEAFNTVHRDISPHNLLVSYDGNLKVIDFGVAKARSEIADKTRTGLIKGKCAYLSPEQLISDDPLDGRSDLFSLGIVAWELLTSQRLFHKPGDTEMQIIQRIQHCEQHVVPPSVFNPEIPKEVDDIVLKALQKDRNLRYPTAEAMQNDLRLVMRSHFPNYAYADTTQLMRALFEEDLNQERSDLRALNDQAQAILVQVQADQTRIVEANPKQKGKGQHLPTPVEMRLGNLESVLKQKASYRHIMVGALYVLSIVGIKLDERYSLLDRFFLPAEADVTAKVDPGAEKREPQQRLAQESEHPVTPLPPGYVPLKIPKKLMAPPKTRYSSSNHARPKPPATYTASAPRSAPKTSQYRAPAAATTPSRRPAAPTKIAPYRKTTPNS